MTRKNEFLDGYLTYLEGQKILINEFRQLGEDEAKYQTAKKLIANEVRMIRLLNPLLAYLPYNFPYVDFDGGDLVFQIEECDNNVFHVVMNDLLPHRFDYDELDSITIREVRTRIALDYVTSLMAYDKIEHIQVRDKVFVYFINYYEEGVFQCDVDNLEIKLFLDNVIVPAFVSDDSGDKVSFAMSSVKGDKTHTEVYIGNFEDIIPYFSF